jgi:competence protein ComEA
MTSPYDISLAQWGRRSRWYRAGMSSLLIAIWIGSVIAIIPTSPQRWRYEAPRPLLPWRVDPQTATAAQLTLLPGIGAKRADRIVDARRRGGVFTTPLQVAKAAGMGVRTAERFADDLRWTPLR